MGASESEITGRTLTVGALGEVMRRIGTKFQEAHSLIAAQAGRIVQLETRLAAAEARIANATAPAPVVNVELPRRRSISEIERDGAGQMVRVSQVEETVEEGTP